MSVSLRPDQQCHAERSSVCRRRCSDGIQAAGGARVTTLLTRSCSASATYKLATLMALIGHCIENLPANPEDVLHVPRIRGSASLIADGAQARSYFGGPSLASALATVSRAILSCRAISRCDSPSLR